MRSEPTPSSRDRRRLAAAYDELATTYVEQTSMAPELVAFGQQHVIARCMESALPVLDVGVGTGRNMSWIERFGLTAVGIDISPQMLRQAARRVSGSVAIMDQRTMAFRSDSFAGVWCMGAFSHVPKQDAASALTEFARVLVVDGPLFIGVKAGHGEGWEPCSYGPVERFFSRYTTDELARVVCSAGFLVLAVDSHTTSSGQDWLTLAARNVEPPSFDVEAMPT